MNKSELIEHIALQADISKAAAARALEAVIGGVTASLIKGDSVSLLGFGTFAVSTRPARVGRNPRTGEEIKIKKAKVKELKPGWLISSKMALWFMCRNKPVAAPWL